MAKPEELLAAGAYLPVNEKLKSETVVDSVSARVYRHPALGSRPVVRLTADNLAAGDDLTMEFLGFSAPEVVGPVAKRQRQALGFPGWALVNDPDHARFALELVKEFKKAVRKSKAKPGHGYEEFVEIGKRLGKSVAHFLPSFWEQVGREFIGFDNATYASRAFGKAREAEKVHALKVDESIRKDSFLEFALAGAVSIKALTEYGKELASTHNPKEAWTFFRELCVRRTLGGMPPWTSMLKDIQPLLKATKLNLEEEVHSILVEIIDSPAISRASMGFWDSISKYVGSLAAKNHHVAGVLLNMIPQSNEWQENLLWPWLDHLDSWGVLENGWKDNVPEEAQPKGGPAAWLSRVIQSGRRLRQKLFDIVQAMAPRLRKDNVPIDPYQKQRWGHQLSADVDLLDLLIESKIPFTDPLPEMEIDLLQWAELDEKDKSAKDRPRDPVHLTTDSRFNERLKAAVAVAVGAAEFEKAASGKEAMKEARREWLNSLVNGLADGALPTIEDSLDTIEKNTSKAIFQEFPEVLERFQSIDILPAITRTLQTGIMDEYGWPALEKVCEDFAAAGHRNPSFYGQFPYLIVTDKLKAVVLRGNEIVHEAELKLPKGKKLERLMYIDGDLLVWAEASTYQSVCFWNSDPQPGEPEYHYFYDEGVAGVVIDAPTGGTFVGEKIVHKGGTAPGSLQATDHIFSDGSHWWVRSFEYDSQLGESVASIHEVDPVSGKKGRQSMPSFFENYIEDGWKLNVSELSLFPFGSIFPNSLLGSKDGLIGTRVRYNSSNVTQIEGIDGRSLTTSEPKEIEGLLCQVGTDKFLAVQPVSGYRKSSGFTLWDPTGSFAVADVKSGVGGFNRGQAANIPWQFLHGFEVRDLAASRKLRSITDDEVRLLLDAERQDAQAEPDVERSPSKTSSIIAQVRGHASTGSKSKIGMSEAEDYPQLDAAIQKLIGEKSAPRLRVGLRALIIRSAQQFGMLRKMIERRSAEPSEKAAVAISSQELAASQFARFIDARLVSLPSSSFFESLADLTEFFAGRKPTAHFIRQRRDFLQSVLEAVPQKLWSGYCEDPSDKSWISFMELWCHSPFQSLRGSFRTFAGVTSSSDFLAAEIAAVNEGETPPKTSVGEQMEWLVPVVGKSSRFLVSKDYQGYSVLEYSPNGTFESIPDLNEREGTSVIYGPGLWTIEQIEAFIELVKNRPPTLPSAEFLKSFAKQVSSTAAELAIVWFGFPNSVQYGTYTMPTHLREGCKLKARECAAAWDSLKALPVQTQKSLLHSVLSGGPADLWEDPPTRVAERLRQAWSQMSERLPLSAEWIEKLSDAYGYGVETHIVLKAMNGPSTHPLFGSNVKWTLGNKEGRASVSCAAASPVFNESILRVASLTIAMLAYGLPGGDPARDKMCEVYQATSAALANPDLILEGGSTYFSDPKAPDRLKTLIESTVGRIQVVDKLNIADDGVLAVIESDMMARFALRPQSVAAESQFEKVLNQLVTLTAINSESYVSPDIFPAVRLIELLRLFRSSGFRELVDRIRNTPVPAGGYEANPILSAPDVLKLVMKKHKLSEDAAAYYLQLLTLPDPTDKNVALWNGWTAAAIKKLGKELVDKELVLEASRSRAGRKFFLAGGWEDLKAPHLPIETWKMPLYQMVRDAWQRATPPMSRIVPLEPVHQLFAKAWKRIVDGDLPKYEEVQ